jgi:hypothetical protein
MINSVADSDAVKITEKGGSLGPAIYSGLYPYIIPGINRKSILYETG